jgi:hypothetical protein
MNRTLTAVTRIITVIVAGLLAGFIGSAIGVILIAGPDRVAAEIPKPYWTSTDFEKVELLKSSVIYGQYTISVQLDGSLVLRGGSNTSPCPVIDLNKTDHVYTSSSTSFKGEWLDRSFDHSILQACELRMKFEGERLRQAPQA